VSYGSETPGSPPIIPERVAEPLPRRTFTTVPAEYLTRLFTEHTDLQAQKLVEVHKGKWIRVSGRVSDVSGREGGVIQVILYPPNFEPLLESMMLAFDAGDHADRAATLRRGDVVSVEGQITRVSRMHIKLDHCELEEHQARERMALAKRGALRATFGPRALIIRNEGQASARSVTLTLNGVPAAEADLFRGRQVQIATIAAGASVSFPFVVWDGMPRQHDVVVTWDDESGERGSWESGLSIPPKSPGRDEA
jgi:hypothetical protein